LHLALERSVIKMKFAILALVFACYHLAEGANWALLVAGSNGYSNYRHQADVSHAYQLMRRHGIPASNIVTMMYDDIAYNSRNPYKGNIINQPNGPNVYAGVTIDYRGGAVNARTFLDVLKGNSYALKNVGNGKSIQSGPGDNVFVYYADHGNKNIIGFPGGALYSRDLNSAIEYMYANNRYSKMVFYIEACFSGSMFYGRLRSDRRVYAMTAANRFESSYSCYYDRARRAYLGDEFSVRWMQDSEAHDFSSHSLDRQYQNVKSQVRMSHVMRFGDISSIPRLPIGSFQSGNGHYYAQPSTVTPPPITDAVPTWDVPYMTLFHQLQDANTTEERMTLLYEMQQEQMAQYKIKETMEKIAGEHSANPALLMLPQEVETSEEQQHCYEQSVVKYLETCKEFEGMDYAMKDLHVFANICNRGTPFEHISKSIEDACAV